LEASQPHKIATDGSASALEVVARTVGGSLDSVMINSSAVLCCLVWYAKKRVKSDDIQLVCFIVCSTSVCKAIRTERKVEKKIKAYFKNLFYTVLLSRPFVCFVIIVKFRLCLLLCLFIASLAAMKSISQSMLTKRCKEQYGNE
jgi:hypothetical protein